MDFELIDYLMDWIEAMPETFDLENCETYLDYLQLNELN